MPPNETPFEQFFAAKIKERGISLKKLSDVTGIAPMHIESLLRGDYENVPSAPYLHGYLVRLGHELDFDGEEWWMRLKKENVVRNSGERDTLPHNRFIREAPPKYLWAIGVAAIIIIYLALQAPRIFGKPTLAMVFPGTNPYTTSANTITLTGTVSGADSLSLVGANGEAEQITVSPDGSWSKGILLGAGLNPIEISAKKFLGGETTITENIFYQASSTPNSPSSTAPATGTSSTVPIVPTGTASGTSAF